MPEIQVKGLFDYNTADAAGLSFRQGDIITVYKRLPSGWWEGMVDGKRGWFPSNFVSAPELVVFHI